MTKEQKSIIDILSAAIHKKPLQLPADNDWKRLFDCSVELGIPAVVFEELSNSPYGKEIPKPVKIQWFAWLREIEHKNNEQNKVLYKVVKLLKDNGVPSVLLKGQGIAMEYPKPERRSSGDIDLYVGSKNYNKARQLIIQQGWLENKKVHEDIKHLEFNVDGVMIELHYYSAIIPGHHKNICLQTMMEEGLRNTDCGFYVSAEGQATTTPTDNNSILVRTLPVKENTIYTFVHMFGHFIGGGVSLRQFTDWALLVKKLGNTDTADINEQKENMSELLESIGHLKAWQTLGCLLVSTFGFSSAEVPCYNVRYEDKAKPIIELILSDGEEGNNSNTHADGIKQKLLFLSSMSKNFRRVFSLFPHECCAYSLQQILNTLTKYIKLATGRLH